MTTETQETISSAVDEEKKPVPKVKLTLADGTEIEIATDSRVYASIKNLEEEQKATAFKETRDKFESNVTKVIQSRVKGFEGALEGMSLILDFATDDGAKLHETGKVTIRQRAKRSDSASQ